MLTELGKKAKAASRVIGVADTETKNRALITIADSLEANRRNAYSMQMPWTWKTAEKTACQGLCLTGFL